MVDNLEACITLTEKEWVFFNVPHSGRDGVIKPYEFKLTKKSFFNEERVSPHQLSKKLQEREEKLPTVKEYLSLFRYLKSNQNHYLPDQKKLFGECLIWLKNLIRRRSSDPCFGGCIDGELITGTRVDYSSNTKDGTVIQGLGRDDCYVLGAPGIIGSWDNDYILVKDIQDKKIISPICETEDLSFIDDSLRGLFEKDPALLALNFIPSEVYLNLDLKPEEFLQCPVMLSFGNGMSVDHVFGINVFPRDSHEYLYGHALGLITQPAPEKKEKWT